MMQECPRCGFSQPKDRYCANCGLDIVHFHPAPEAAWKKVVANTAFQVSCVIGLISIMISTLYFKQTSDIQSFGENPVTTIQETKTPKPEKPTQSITDSSAQKQPAKEDLKAAVKKTAHTKKSLKELTDKEVSLKGSQNKIETSQQR